MTGEPPDLSPVRKQPPVRLKQRPRAPCVSGPNEEIEISHWPVGERRVRGVGEAGSLQQHRFDSVLGENVDGLMQELLQS